MKLRTFTGVDKETTCACGCNQRILARPDVMVTVDMDSFPRKKYIPGHAGNGYGSTSYAKKVPKPKEEAKPTPAPTPPAPSGPTPAGPSPTSPQPQVDPAPVPTPKVVTGTAPSLADNRPWKILQVTIGLGDYSSIKAGVADFARDDETPTQLGARLVAELTQDIKTELDVVHNVQQGKPLSVPTPGVATTPATSSLASAGAPAKPVAAQAGGGTASGFVTALELHRQRLREQEAAVNDPETLEAIRRVHLELGDISVTRSMKKGKIAQAWLETRGYERFEEADSRDLAGLRDLLVKFDMVNEPEKFAAQRATAQSLGTQVYG